MKVTQDSFKTRKDQLVVLIPELKKETESGIIIPESVLAERLQQRGGDVFFEVIAVGSEVTDIKVGDKVLVSRVQDVPVEANDPTFKVGVCREYDVVGFY
jgi:co-chaperonin GroES (HSP10)